MGVILFCSFPCMYSFHVLISWCAQGVMVGWNDRAIVDALQDLAQAMGNQNRGDATGAAEYQRLDRFL